MRPTFSIIAFTVLSGTGYGLWFLIGASLLAAWPYCAMTPLAGEPAPVYVCIYSGIIATALIAGFVLVTIGLLSSLAHLGRPSRAWRALSQWRSSWLSREGVAALLTYLPALALGACFLLVPSPPDSASGGGVLRFNPLVPVGPLGALLALGALATVYCTANIYASLKPIRAWHNRLVTPAYLLLGLYSGALLLAALTVLPYADFGPALPVLLIAVVVLAVCCAWLKIAYWRDIDRSPTIGPGRATGLEALGEVRSFEPPHTEENYLTHEMGFVLARRHSARLRRIALLAGFALPALLSAIGFALPSLRLAAAWLALGSGLVGLFVERWLFFAEARHIVIAYYGR
jgi:DMSO reductase anchor subunit